MTTPKVQAFLDELNALQKRHGLHLEHDDGFAVYDGEDTIRASDETQDARVIYCTERFRDAWVHRHGQTRNVRYWFAALCSALGRTTAAQRRRDRIARKPCTHEYEPPLYHGACRKCGERRA